MSTVTAINGDGPRVRVTDPLTSHLAADSNDSTVAASQTFVFDLLWWAGPLADHELVAVAEKDFAAHPHAQSWTPQRLRSARAELVGRGLVHVVEGESRRTGTGRNAHVWAVTR